MEFSFAYITCRNKEEAQRIARAAVSEKLAACGNILPEMHSLYSWKGELCEDTECVLILKTRRSLESELRDLVIRLHSYEVPCVVFLPVHNGNPAYFSWLEAETREA